MGKLFLTTLIILTIQFVGWTQTATVNNTPIDSIKSEYVRIVGTSKLFSTKVNIELDFGQYNNFWKMSDTQVKDKDGKLLELNSMVDALNFMAGNGYEFVQAYVITTGSTKCLSLFDEESKKVMFIC